MTYLVQNLCVQAEEGFEFRVAVDGMAEVFWVVDKQAGYLEAHTLPLRK